MKLLTITLMLILLGCKVSNKITPEDTQLTRSEEYQNEINEFLLQDAENKRIEKEILEEIRIAEENNDADAFKFFFQEYMKVERLIVPDWMKEEPNYVEGGMNVKY